MTASADFTAKLWDSSTGKEILNLKGHTQELTSVAFSRDGRFALTGSQDGTAILWLTSDWTQPQAVASAAGRGARYALPGVAVASGR
jgi:WD40 repeat protein